MASLRACILSYILALTQAQRFPPGIAFAWNGDESLSAECRTALNKTVDCSSVLPAYSNNSFDLSSENLTSLCVEECSASLASAREDIESACTTDHVFISSDGITYPATPATNTIDLMIDMYDMLCLRDIETHEFCYTALQDWSAQDGLTDEQACSDCFLRRLQWRISPPSSQENPDAASVFSSLTSSCSRTGYEPSMTTSIVMNSTAIVPAEPTSSCAPLTSYTVKADDTCHGLCIAKNVSTWDLLATNGFYDGCQDFPTAGTDICLPLPCDIYTVQPGDTCDSIAAQQPRENFVRTKYLKEWNSFPPPLCSNMDAYVGQQICVSRQNTTFINPPEEPKDPGPLPCTGFHMPESCYGDWASLSPTPFTVADRWATSEDSISIKKRRASSQSSIPAASTTAFVEEYSTSSVSVSPTGPSK